MLLVTFHGGTSGINNAYCYDTNSGTLLSCDALRGIDSNQLSEIRALVNANGYLYVVNGAKGISNVLVFQHQPTEKPQHFFYLGIFVGPSLSSKGHFTSSIAHPFDMAFDGAGSAYLSNQDTNVVARIGVSADYRSGTLPPGCQSSYLINQEPNLCPSRNCVFLDGTFVASQQGNLHDVKIVATSVPTEIGGLAVVPADGQGKISHSVRGVAINNGMLFVCDEPAQMIRIYALADGSYLCASPGLPGNPTHLSVQNGGLYVSAKSGLYWSPLPADAVHPSLTFSNVLTASGSNTIGGISFSQDSGSAFVYVCFQSGTGTTGTGSIGVYALSEPNVNAPPTLTPVKTLASSLPDTPEFVLYLPDSST
jgi:hypothetical protein